MSSRILLMALLLVLVYGLTAQIPSMPVGQVVGTGAPVAACTPGQKYFRTDATAGQNDYTCASTGGTAVWLPLASGSAPGSPGPAGPTGPAGPAGSNGAAGVPGYSPNTLLSGGGVTWKSGLTFTISPATYYIAGVLYSSPLTEKTLGAADGALDRIDSIVVDSTGTMVVIPGTPAAPPSPEVADPATQLSLTFIYVAATALVPSNVAVDDIYHENTEWTTAKSGAPIDLASANNPHAGAVDIEATVSVSGNYARFTGAAFDPAAKNNLVFWIRSKATWASTRSLQFQWYSTGTKRGSIVVLNEGAFGFASSSTAAYQQIVIPMRLFAANGLSVNRLQITTAGTGTGIGFYLDDITLQTGIPDPVAPAGLTWCGAWVSTTAYPVNCQVTHGNATWVAMAGNTNSAPSLTNANWTTTNPGPLWNASLATDHTVSGATARLTAGAALTFGQVCYMGADGKMEKGNATAIATAGVWAMVADASIAENSVGNFLLHGFATDASWSWATVGSLLVLDKTVAGGMLLIANAPAAANNAIQVLGTATAATVVYFSPQLVMVEHL